MKKITVLTVLLVIVVFAMPAYADPKPKDVNVVNTPMPITVQKNSNDTLVGIVDLTEEGEDDLDARAIHWKRPDNTAFSIIPEGYALFVTDIIVSYHSTPTPSFDEYFHLVFVAMYSTGAGRLFDIAGTGLPYSHSFTTPIFFPSLTERGGKLGITRTTDDRLKVILTGYLEPITE